MVTFIKYAFSAIIFVSIASTALGIHCNICNFLNNSTCSDPFVPNELYRHNCHLLTAPQYVQAHRPGKHLEAMGCIKKVFAQDDKTIVQRSCYWGNLSDTKIVCDNNPSLPHLKQLSCDVCDTEMCNSSTAIGSIAFVVAMFCVLARILS